MGMATNSLRASPSTKTGVARSTKFVTVITWSVSLFCRTAAHTPRPIAIEDGDDGGDDHHAQRHEEMRPELRGDGLTLGRVAEVALNRVGEPDPVALPQRVVQVEQVLAGDDRRVRGVRVGPEERERVARGADQKEDQDRREEEDDDADQKAPNDVGEHGGSLGVETGNVEGGADRQWPTPPSRLHDPLRAD